jgi:hypothetical protein
LSFHSHCFLSCAGAFLFDIIHLSIFAFVSHALRKGHTPKPIIDYTNVLKCFSYFFLLIIS